MQVVSSTQGEAQQVLSVTGRLDANTAPEFDDACSELVSADCRYVVLDFEGLDYISSAGLRSILTLAKDLDDRAGTVVVCNLHGIVGEVFEISGFSNIIPVHGGLDEALAGS